MCKTAWMLAGALGALPLSPAVAADGEGLRQGPNQIAWARWQGRLSLVTSTDPWRLGIEGPASKLSSASLMGDYYFGRSLDGPNKLGGLRATSGLIFGPRSSLGTSSLGLGSSATGTAFSIGSRSVGRALVPATGDVSESATLPYLGIGYTGLSPRTGWGFSADLGLVAKTPGNAVRAIGGPSLDDLIRDMRMAPLLQLGVSYSF
ncbi:MAG: hypothetical protein H7Y61_08425 [Rhizobiales bacterium]|nr:hypothetical protein [Rhizobacter sp.]